MKLTKHALKGQGVKTKKSKIIEKCTICGINFDMANHNNAAYIKNEPVCECCREDYSLELDIGLSPKAIKKRT